MRFQKRSRKICFLVCYAEFFYFTEKRPPDNSCVFELSTEENKTYICGNNSEDFCLTINNIRFENLQKIIVQHNDFLQVTGSNKSWN